AGVDGVGPPLALRVDGALPKREVALANARQLPTLFGVALVELERRQLPIDAFDGVLVSMRLIDRAAHLEVDALREHPRRILLQVSLALLQREVGALQHLQRLI